MKKKRLFFVISFIVLCSIGLTLCFIFFYPKKIKVPIATHTILSWEQITQDDITYKYLYPKDISDNIYLNGEDIIGMYTSSKVTIFPNSYFFIGSIIDENQMHDGPYRYLSKDEVAYDLYIDEIKINPTSINAGMNIDLYLTLKDKDMILSDLLISNLHILGKYDKDGKIIRNKNEEVKSISVRLKRDDVSYVNKALKLGDVSVIVSSEAYNDVESKINTNSEIYKYLINNHEENINN